MGISHGPISGAPISDSGAAITVSAGDTLTPPVGVLALTGLAAQLQDTINMPDEP